MNPKIKGYLCGIIAAATYGMIPLFALPLYKSGMNPNSVLFFRYLFAIPIIAAMIKIRGRDFKLQRKEILPLSVLALLMTISSITLFYSYKFMDAGIASTILFVYPIMVAVIMALVYKEKLTIQTAVCILMAMSGIYLLYRNGDGVTLSLTGTLLAVSSALSYAVYLVGINNSSLKNMATLKLTFYVIVFGMTVFLLRIVFGQELILPGKWYLWANVLALSVFPTVISFVCTTTAIQYVGSTQTAILGALEPVTAIFFGMTVFGEMLTLREFIGLIMIILAVTIVISGGKITLHLTRFRKMFPKLPRKK